MCGILAVIGNADLQEATELSKQLSHRGPDERDSVVTKHGHILCHERLAIVDLNTGKQPLVGREDNYLIHNGEIYNHKELARQYCHDHKFKTNSDSEIILHLYQEKGERFLDLLDGVFAFVLVDGDKVFAGRDPIGVKPLFYGHDELGNLWFASETKALITKCIEINEFPPGHYYTQEAGFVRYFKPAWFCGEKAVEGPELIHDTLVAACKKRLMSDVPLGVLLSGGLDSSLVSSIVAKEFKKSGKTLKSFSVGLSKGSSDLEKARKVAEFLVTEHHEIIFTAEQGIQILRDLIWKTETYDVTTIRASTPMLLMSKYIKQCGVKVVMSGEGADEMFGGYLYFSNAPSEEEFHGECLRRVKRLHTSDVLRADRSTMGEGVEARVPFLDKEFLKVVMSLDPKYKTIIKGERMEKDVLRQAFNRKGSDGQAYLPDEVLWRQKEQFSDGVGYSWVDSLKELADRIISEEEFSKRNELFPHNTPFTKEAFMYRVIHSEFYGHKDSAALIKKWIPRWQDYDIDPSGRANTYHTETYHEEGHDEDQADEV
ncbi:MAG: asparagine synthase B, partial [Halobacteriovoraceae bacterium]|nr:asparagine synthase B [Halobacteriovoraceae bacterium]